MNADVNSVKSEITWDWDGANALYTTTSLTRAWLNGTGWDYNSSYSSVSYGNFNNYEYAYNSSYTHFRNSSFPACFGSWVNVYYAPQTVYGYKSGYLAGEVWRTKSGASCQSLISFPTVQLARTQN